MKLVRYVAVLAISSTTLACGSAPSTDESGDAVGQTSEALRIIKKPPAPLQSFLVPESWSKDFVSSSGWNPAYHVRRLADIDHDGKQDIVGFGYDGVWISHSTGVAFEPAQFVIADFGTATGWNNENHVRTTGDINGDGKADIVAFGNDGVWTAYSTGTGFAAPVYDLADFGYNQGWRVDKHTRLVGDVNGDGRDDIVGFGDAGVYLSLSTASGIGPAVYALAAFGANDGWNNTDHVRTLADINGDGRADLVGFGYDGVWTALSNGSSFDAVHYVLAAFGNSAASGSWVGGGRHERRVIDIDGDHKADIVGFGESATAISRATGDGGFTVPTQVLADFGFTQMGYSVPGASQRYIGDFNGDGYPDIVGYDSHVDVRRSVGGANGFFYSPQKALTIVGNIGGQIEAGDVDGDGKLDLVGFGSTDVTVERSTANAIPPPPPAPSNLTVMGATTSSLTLGWTDNASDEVAYGIYYQNQVNGTNGSVSAPPNTTSKAIGGLSSNSKYCFTLSVIDWFGISSAPQVCGNTLVAGPTITLTSSTHTSLALSLSAPGASALRWQLEGVSPLTTQNGATATPVFTGLTAGTSYCLSAAQEVNGAWSVDSRECFSTPSVQTGTDSLAMTENPPPYTGYISYTGFWTPNGRTITGMKSAYNLYQGIAFVKPGHDPTTECGDANALVFLIGNATLTQSQVAQISWPQPNGSIAFVGCPSNFGQVVPNLLFTNIQWKQ